MTKPDTRLFTEEHITYTLPQHGKTTQKLSAALKKAAIDYLKHIEAIQRTYYSITRQEQSLASENIPHNLTSIILGGMRSKPTITTRNYGDGPETRFEFTETTWASVAPTRNHVTEDVIREPATSILRRLGEEHAKYMQEGLHRPDAFTNLPSNGASWDIPLSDDNVGVRLLDLHEEYRKHTDYYQNPHVKDTTTMLNTLQDELQTLVNHILEEKVAPLYPHVRGETLPNAQWFDAFTEEEHGYRRQPHGGVEGGRWFHKAVFHINGPLSARIEYKPSPMHMKVFVSQAYSDTQRTQIREKIADEMWDLLRVTIEQAIAAQETAHQRTTNAVQGFIDGLYSPTPTS